MSLRWDVGKIADWKTVTTSPSTRGKEEQKWHPITEAIVMSSMVCGYGQITEANYKKVAKRLAQYQMLNALIGSQDMPEIYITEEDVKRHIGLTVNVTPTTETAWHKHLIDMITRDAGVILNGRRNAYRAPDSIKDDTRENISGYDILERLWALRQKKENGNG